MSGFTEGSLTRRLAELTSSQQSVQTLSLWLIHHRKHYATVVKVWLHHLLKAKEGRIVTLLYLANDVIQNSKRKGPEYGKEFLSILDKTFLHVGSSDLDEKSRQSIAHILNVWLDRRIYETGRILKFIQLGGLSDVEVPKEKKRKSLETSLSIAKKARNSSGLDLNNIQDLIETHIGLSPKFSTNDAPKPDDLINAITDLESNSASSDAAVREKIASLPPEVSEIDKLENLEGREPALKLSKVVNSTVELLNDYNNRLLVELEKRKKIGELLKLFAVSQKDSTVKTKQRLEEYVVKLDKLKSIHKELKKHVDNLPNVKQLPELQGGLAPLPSVGDLFSRH